MPCKDWSSQDRWPEGYETRVVSVSKQEHELIVGQMQKRLDAATRAACEAIKVIECELCDYSLQFLGISIDSENWWKQHKKEDAIRLEKLRESALAKLTPEERKALDL